MDALELQPVRRVAGVVRLPGSKSISNRVLLLEAGGREFDPAVQDAYKGAQEGDLHDLSKVDEIGFVDLTPGSGHGFGGFSNLGCTGKASRPSPRRAVQSRARALGATQSLRIQAASES